MRSTVISTLQMQSPINLGASGEVRCFCGLGRARDDNWVSLGAGAFGLIDITAIAERDVHEYAATGCVET